MRKAKLKEVARIQGGYAFKSSDMGTEGCPIIKIKNITPPTIDIVNVERVPYEVIETISNVDKYKLKKGDVLIAMTGATVGKIGRFPDTTEVYYLNQRVGKLVLTNPEKANYDFLYYVLSQPGYIRQIFSMADGSAQANISASQIESLEIPLPPLPEQKAIAHILGTLDDKIELNRRMNETLEEMARAIFKSWFVDFDPVIDNALKAGNPIPDALAEKAARRRAISTPKLSPEIARLFPDSFEDSSLGPIPKGWRVDTMDSHFRITMGQSPPGDTYNENGDGLPFYQGCIDFGFRFPSRRIYCTAPTRIANKGDTLLTVRAPVGAINMAIEYCCIGRGLAAIRHTKGYSSYTYYFVHSLRPFFERFESEGTVFGSITKKDFSSLKCVIPSTNLIEYFEIVCKPLDNMIEKNERESRTLADLRDILLPKLISGQIRIKDAEKFLGEML